MKFVRFSALIALVLLGSAFLKVNAQDKELFKQESFMSTSGELLPFRILKPVEFDSTLQYPLVLFLHGAGERGDDNESQLLHGATIFSSDYNREYFPCFVLVPQCPKVGYWSSAKFTREKYPIDFDYNYSYEITPALEAAIELVQYFREEPYIDLNRTYVTGLSMGGMGSFEAVARFPELFAAAAPVCGGGDASALNREIAKIPFWIFHGDSDSVVPVENSRKMYTRLTALDGEVKYTEYPDIDHSSWEKAYVEPELLPWLFSKKK